MGVQTTHHIKKIILGDIISFTDFCFPQTKLIRLASFINGVHKIDAINRNRSLEKLFFRKMCFYINLFEWHNINVGYGRPMIEGKILFLRTFSQKIVSYNFFWLVWYKLSMGVHMNDDGNKKHI